MSKLTISIFGSKIFLEIISEIKLFSNLKLKFYEEINLCIKDAQKQNSLVIFFVNRKNIDLLINKKIDSFPSILVSDFPVQKALYTGELTEKLIVPFSILDLKKKIVFLIAKNEFRNNSLIQLNDYIVDKNERKIKKNNLELQLSEKEINFIVLFKEKGKPLSKNLLLKDVWNYSLESETHTVETHIHRLRKKISEKFGDHDFIKNNDKGYYI